MAKSSVVASTLAPTYHVARMKPRGGEIRGACNEVPDCAALHPGYGCATTSANSRHGSMSQNPRACPEGDVSTNTRLCAIVMVCSP